MPGIANLQAETALFAEGSLPLTRRLTGTLGARLTYENGTGIYFDPVGTVLQRSARNVMQPTFTLALDWHPGGRLSAFAHYQQGYRAGGLAIAPAGSGVATQKFDADELNMDEFGIRLGDETHDRFWLRASAFWADWNHIQADLVDSAGLTTTANIGRGRIYGLEGEASWRPRPALKLSGAFFVNASRLVAPTAEFAASAGQPLPNVARGGGRIAAEWRTRIGRDTTLAVEASGRYVGRSSLGVGSTFDLPQGNYTVADAALRVLRGPLTVSLGLDNLGNVHGNSFAFGNPFTLEDRRQVTPLRPRTLRLGLSARF
jgi:outer membrane receptor protein involved in Fe transport